MEIFPNNISKILKNKDKIEKALNIKLSAIGKKLRIESDQINEYLAKIFFDAVEAGFPIKIALLLADQDYMLEKISIKNLTKRQNLSIVRARIIGKKGSTIKLIGDLSNCHIHLHENIVYMLGRAEDIKIAFNAIEKIIQGSKQSSAYSYLEKQRKSFFSEDLGLKEAVRTKKTREIKQ